MNLPNKLTISRIVLAPVLLFWFFSVDLFKNMSVTLYAVVLGLLYIVMELSDMLDGKIARKRGLVTDLGKVMDPFGDVMCHLTFFTCFVTTGIMPIWAFALIMWRELFQCFMRMIVLSKGTAMAANIFGKLKTGLYAVATVSALIFRVLILSNCVRGWMNYVIIVLFAACAFASVVSFLIYVVRVVKSGILKDFTR